MGAFKITGGLPLSGTVVPQGAKNEALQIISAVLLTPEKVTISNIPNIRDVMKLIELMGDMGVVVKQVDEHTFSFEAR
ncbi:MAG: UDP-N-acetylglucosamine 1-carboxyvinyltransferase, partial [Bacteroidia bacterium]|nr:UDP-N-acetylglucosamine 1-carboxyvinyltransferase [Bacteroidia bacterium]